MKLIDITNYLESFAPLRYQESYDNSGFLIGDIGAEFKGAVISLDVTEAVIDECISLGYNLIISHHPLIFNGLKKITCENYIERAVLKAIKHDIAIYAIHTNLDNVFSEGVSSILARQLDIQVTDVLRPIFVESKLKYGAGVIGYTQKQINETEFLNFIKQNLGLKCLRHTKLLGQSINNVAICGGSGSFLIDEAINHGADIFISADFKYHDFFDADNRIILVDIGHYESEIYTINLIYDKLKNNFSNFAARLTRVITNPINYL